MTLVEGRVGEELGEVRRGGAREKRLGVRLNDFFIYVII